MANYRGQDNKDERIVKTETLFAQRPRSFVFEFRSLDLRISGDDMTAVNFHADILLEVDVAISFVHQGSTYTFRRADVKIVRRLRSRKFSLEPSAVTIV